MYKFDLRKKLHIYLSSFWVSNCFCSQIETKDTEIQTLKGDVDSMNSRFKTIDLQKSVDITQQMQKWEEFSKLAESMKNLSQTMISQTASQSPRTPQQYWTIGYICSSGDLWDTFSSCRLWHTYRRLLAYYIYIIF